MSNAKVPHEKFIPNFLNVMRAFRNQYRPTEMINLSVSQLEILIYIFNKKQAAMKELADFLGIKPPSVTVLIDNLEEQGFLGRCQDKKDHRFTHLVLTKKGRDILAKTKEYRKKIAKKLLSNLTIEEQNKLFSLLHKMIKNN